MKALRNKVTLIGNLGATPEVKELDNGKKVARVAIATNESYRDKDGNKVDNVQWHSLVMWGGLASVAQKYLDKGAEIAIEGKLNNRSWTDQEGTKRFTTEVVVSDLLMLRK
jgi:single-strand DNA-binding protein